jgi:nucleoside-diphosphate-sugar epimerase
MTPLKILITGINGLIGGVLQKALAGRYDVYGCIRTEGVIWQ